MIITRGRYLHGFLYLGIFYYLGVADFISRVVTGNTRNVRKLTEGSDAVLSNAAGNLVAQAIGGTLLLMAVFFIFKFQAGILRHLLQQYRLIVFVLLLVLGSVFWSVEVGISFRRVVALSTLFLFAIVIAETFKPEFVIHSIARAIGYCALAGFVYVVIDPGNGLINEGIRQNAFLGIFYDKNGGARAYAYAVIILFKGVVCFSRRDCLLFIVLLAAILLSQSATALMLCLVGCLLVSYFIFLNSAPTRMLARKQVYTGVLLLLFGFALSYLFYEFILSFLGRDPTLTNRTIIWELLWPSVEDRLMLGYGYGAYWSSLYVDSFIQRWGFIGNAHNGYLDVLLHGGLAMLVAFLWLLCSGLKRCAYCISILYGWNIFIPMWIIMMFMIIVNFVGTIIPNHKSLDMFLLVLILAFSLRTFFVNRRGYAY